MADSPAQPRFTRRTFLGWWMASLMTATVVTGLAPILVFLWPAPPKGQKKTALTVSIGKPLDQLADGDAIKFDAPTSPNAAFIMADGGGDNAPGELAFSGFVVKNQGKVNVFAINCSHLGCSVALNPDAKTFDCPCQRVAVPPRRHRAARARRLPALPPHLGEGNGSEHNHDRRDHPGLLDGDPTPPRHPAGGGELARRALPVHEVG